MGREGFLEKVTQEGGGHTPGACIDHLPRHPVPPGTSAGLC